MNSPRRKPRRNNESNRREELLRVSARLFREKGFDGTTIRDISSAAGMHSGSPFYHFKTKQDILVAVMEQGLAEGLRKTEEVMALPLPPEQKLKGLIRAQLGTFWKRATTSSRCCSTTGVRSRPPTGAASSR
jgi:TetR/AcrR family transcriptional regulator, cholesterol catabolism regulator